MTGQPGFLPMTVAEGERLGIDRFDIIQVTGDAYADQCKM